MTAQVPERMIINGKPHWLYAEPLYEKLRSKGVEIGASDVWTTACHRRYVGTWGMSDRRLMLLDICFFGRQELALADDERAQVLDILSVREFPVWADWFDGTLRIPTGPMVVRGFHGWSSWFTSERIITCRQGMVVRDREVNTLAILEWAMRRDRVLKENLDPDDIPGGPLAWITDEDYDHLRGDWWPPGWEGKPASAALGSWFVGGTWFQKE